MSKRNHSFVMMSKLSDVRGRVNYISSPERQEYLYAVYSTVEDHYWELLAEQNQKDFRRSGTNGKCIEGRELIIMLPPSLMGYDHDVLLKYMTTVFTEKYDVGCCAALHHNKSKTNFHIHLIFSERKIRQEVEHKIASRNMFYNEKGKRVKTKKDILNADGNVRQGCKIIQKGQIYDINFFHPKEEIFKSDIFLKDIKYSLTEAINKLVKDENEKLHVFQKDGLYLATKKIGKNNPRAEEIRVDNYLRQKWNENVDRSLLLGGTEEEIHFVKKENIDKLVEQSIQKNGENPKIFTGILQRAIGRLRGFMEYVRAMDTGVIDKSGYSLTGHDLKIDVTPESLPKRSKGPRPSSKLQELEVMRLQQILENLKMQEKKIYAIEKALIQMKKDLNELQKKWFHIKEKKELQNKIDTKTEQLENAEYMMNLILNQNGYQNVLEVINDLKYAEVKLMDIHEKQSEWDRPEPETKRMYINFPAKKQEKQEEQKYTRRERNLLPVQPKKRRSRGMEL